MKFKSREQQAAVMIQLQGGRARKNRTFARHRTSSKIRIKPVKTTIVRNFWEEAPDPTTGKAPQHSECQKFNSEMRKFGFSKIPYDYINPNHPELNMPDNSKKLHFTRYANHRLGKIVEVGPTEETMDKPSEGTTWFVHTSKFSLLGDEDVDIAKRYHKDYGPYKSEADAKKAILPILVVE